MSAAEDLVFDETLDLSQRTQLPATVAGNFLSLLSGNIVVRVLGFLTIAYLARRLGPATYGQLSWVQAVYAVGLVLMDSGLQALGIRTISQVVREKQRVVNAFAPLRVCLGLLLAILVSGGVTIAVSSPTVRWLALIYSLGIAASALQLDWAFIGLQRMRFVSLGQIIQYLIYATIIFLFVRGPSDVLIVPLASLAGITISGIFLVRAFRRLYPQEKFHVERQEWGSIVRQAVPLGSANLLQQLVTSVPLLLLARLGGESAAGYYNGAYRVAQIPYEAISLLMVTLYPVAASLWKADANGARIFLDKVLRASLILSIPIAVGAMVFGERVLVAIMGPKFLPSALPFQILAWNVVFNTLSIFFAQLVLTMNGKQRELFRAVFGGAVVSLILSAVCIPRWGYIGAAIVSVLSQLAISFFCYLLARPFIKLSLASRILKPLGAAAGMALCYQVFASAGTAIWFSITLGLASYIAILSAIHGIDMRDLQTLKRAIIPPRKT